ncbi:MAG: hypothetical protein RMK84_00550 [Oscillochloridaceae bacterium]|nr:hypothetical protein [Chloroflexaceae bacterium]MDW8388585.1 hypothetical protein [Oscillochloridaceae bacterium]
MGCLFAIFAGMFPRLGVLFIWLARPVLFSAAFGGSWFLPLLGILFLPFTTLMYVLVWGPGGLDFWGWFWVILAFLIDMGAIGGSGYANRDRLGSTATPGRT